MSKFDPEIFGKIKRLTIIALASDDHLVESLVLKGGNAIAFFYEGGDLNSSRASFDLDFAIEEHKMGMAEISERIQKTLTQTFKENGYEIYDYKFQSRPKVIPTSRQDFWGGYLVEFKLYESGKQIAMTPLGSPKFSIDLSKFEYTLSKVEQEIEGYKIYVYSAAMIVFEKIRALCQQLPEYGGIIGKDKFSPRARDFYDIVTILESIDLDINSNESKYLIEHIFSAKRVPLEFIYLLRDNLDFHRDNWKSVVATVPSLKLEDFDLYAGKVFEMIQGLTFLPGDTPSTP
jgi:predicted nucleotidyltransferase component of viral defense system